MPDRPAAAVVEHPPERVAAAVATGIRRGVYARPIPGGGFRPVAVRGERESFIGDAVYPHPVECLEAADAMIAAGERREAEQSLRRLVDALEAGTLAPWPRQRQDGAIEWMVLRVADRTPVAGPFGLRGALARIAELHAAPVARENAP